MKNHQKIVQYWHHIGPVDIEDINHQDHRKDK